jgi:8-oxo-dGTP pyrophosphatase MutT (NUDIX family)
MKLDPESLVRRVQAALDTSERRVASDEDGVAAAVLVLFVYRGDEPSLVFTRKTETVPHHKGQYAFPGGIVETFDASRVETALREAQEEIGLDPLAVEVLGLFDDTPTGTTGFVITPVIALCRGVPRFRADGREIAAVVEIPLRTLLDPACFSEEWWEREGVRHRVVFFTCGEHVVWGATGRILRNLLDVLFPEARRG